MAGQQRGPRNPSQRGDFTGNKKEALQREHAEQLEERRDELGLMDQVKATVRDEGVIDLMGATPTLDLGGQREEQDVDVVTESGQQLDAAGRPDDGAIHDALHGQPMDTQAREPMPAPRAAEQPSGRVISDPHKGGYEVRELEPERPIAATNATEALQRDALTKPCEIRALYDLEDVTIGYGNTHTFREGYRYRVPRWVAAHLEEKSLVQVTNLTPA